MKKFISAIAGGILAVTSVIPYISNAEYTPTFYFTADSDSSQYSLSGSDTIKIPLSAVEDGDVVIKMQVRVEDTTLKASSVSAKFRSESEYIKLQNLSNPEIPVGDVKVYTYNTPEGVKEFSTDAVPFCYGTIDEEGKMTVPKMIVSEIKDSGLAVFSYMSTNAPHSVIGTKSDEYPFCEFEAVVKQGTPEGNYQIVFATQENSEPDEKFQYAPVTTFIGLYNSILDYKYFENPITLDMNIVVGDPKPVTTTTTTATTTATTTTTKVTTTTTQQAEKFILGDVNNDGSIDAIDASSILTAYAMKATGHDMGLTDTQKKSADVNNDGNIDAVDASTVLSYYAYKATGGKDSFTDYLKK